MQDFKGKKILLGVTGGIAAYKSAFLVRALTRQGAEVRVVMTSSAREFITPMTMQALSGHDVRCTLFDTEAERAMSHIELARWADYLVIAPASANSIAKFAHGIADDLLSTLYLVAEIPVFVCPAMNRSMWEHQATQDNIVLLKRRGVIVIGPETGSQACGEEGFGRQSETDNIVKALLLHKVNRLLMGKKVLITAGPTREALDPVRYISNRSSGKMGYALAMAASIAGAEVTLISGPTELPPPPGVNFQCVESAEEMANAVMNHLQEDMIFIAAAAVADYRPKNAAAHKIKKEDNPNPSIELTANPDIVAQVAKSGKAAYVVGFAAETSQVIQNAEKKRINKKLDMIIANQVGKGLGFDEDYNEVTILTAKEKIELSLTNKTSLAGQIIAILAANLQNVAS
ncbi:bifunctional phosphopantothenoylcysteine decarboxylase/phosphopantothenate--cysteine ligase CoaBC [Legionella londiniensis]|uniref:Coenzyme A biosynthesis bifunctional protein CoaBC n=1 Tax=Legionella londiniensis TaxID=45068 RepID=A0A0W0VJM7_9GAMM|nr:bifunctional phosphopantothenoylcysteine decarboxylase/phosphopantothenate--cysteine ligase CoaBC [Legionella londiniensis]KTD20320.1 DNA/pantothenate metabolism flavoprotein [Legionella londiniensis]STX93922.1 DNA/pantothenate metabolism flavoprotein [Legionella londiniensis]